MANAVPISDAIQPVIDRINWRYASLIVMEAADNYLFVAAPLDNATSCNAVLVLNMTTGNWETIDKYDTIPNFRIDNLLSVHFNGVRRLVAIQNGPPALVYLLYEGDKDQTLFDVIEPHFAPIEDMIQTRNYGGSQESGPAGFRDFKRGAVILETLNPNVKITAVAEGVNEETVIRESITKDPRKFYPHGHADFNPATDRSDLPKREDYSSGFPVGDYAYQDFGDLPEGNFADFVVPPISPLAPPPELPQSFRERFRIGVIDHSLALRIENTQGQCIVRSTSVESRESRRRRVAA